MKSFLSLFLLAGIIFFPGIGFSGLPNPPELTGIIESGQLERPILATHAGDGSDRLFIIEQRGTIRIIQQTGQSYDLLPQPFLDIQLKVFFTGTGNDERGLLGLAFHPDYSENGRFFVHYSGTVGNGDTVIAEYHVLNPDDNMAQADEQVVLTHVQPFTNHNGGSIEFGPSDGYLYIGLGDGGAANDPQGNGQNTLNLLGTILRIDINQVAVYGIPPDNPYVTDQNVMDEIYAYGFRNPYRFSFDIEPPHTLICGDVGQNTLEEIDLIESGKNYGWSMMEGSHCFPPGTVCEFTTLTLPVHEYAHDFDETLSRRCSITGGYVYRGSRIPALEGSYIFGDWCSGEIWSLPPDFWMQDGAGRTGNGRTSTLSSGEIRLLNLDIRVAGFGQDEHGELYILSFDDGAVHLLEPGELGVENTVLYP
jgi:glucose/arabinose dehydrogenase